MTRKLAMTRAQMIDLTLEALKVAEIPVSSELGCEAMDVATTVTRVMPNTWWSDDCGCLVGHIRSRKQERQPAADTPAYTLGMTFLTVAREMFGWLGADATFTIVDNPAPYTMVDLSPSTPDTTPETRELALV